jgi:hypothetical protein
MEWLVQQTTLSQGELICCNRCRLAMEAVTLVDIVTGNGKRIRDDSIGAHLLATHPSTWEFPVEKLSTQQDTDSWRKGLVSLTSATFELPFTDILGSWIDTPHHRWEWFYFPLMARFTATLSTFGTATFLPLNIPPGIGPSPAAT